MTTLLRRFLLSSSVAAALGGLAPTFPLLAEAPVASAPASRPVLPFRERLATALAEHVKQGEALKTAQEAPALDWADGFASPSSRTTRAPRVTLSASLRAMVTGQRSDPSKAVIAEATMLLGDGDAGIRGEAALFLAHFPLAVMGDNLALGALGDLLNDGGDVCVGALTDVAQQARQADTIFRDGPRVRTETVKVRDLARLALAEATGFEFEARSDFARWAKRSAVPAQRLWYWQRFTALDPQGADEAVRKLEPREALRVVLLSWSNDAVTADSRGVGQDENHTGWFCVFSPERPRAAAVARVLEDAAMRSVLYDHLSGKSTWPEVTWRQGPYYDVHQGLADIVAPALKAEDAPKLREIVEAETFILASQPRLRDKWVLLASSLEPSSAEAWLTKWLGTHDSARVAAELVRVSKRPNWALASRSFWAATWSDDRANYLGAVASCEADDEARSVLRDVLAKQDFAVTVTPRMVTDPAGNSVVEQVVALARKCLPADKLAVTPEMVKAARTIHGKMSSKDMAEANAGVPKARQDLIEALKQAIVPK